MNNFGEKVAFIWSVADLLRDAFKRGKVAFIWSVADLLVLMSIVGFGIGWIR
jgi:hypothetical protein